MIIYILGIASVLKQWFDVVSLNLSNSEANSVLALHVNRVGF